VYQFRVERRLDLLDLTQLNHKAIHMPPGLRAMIRQGHSEVHQQARMTGTSVAARLMARTLLDQLMTARGLMPGMTGREILPDWLPMVGMEPSIDEDWDSEALGGMTADSGMFDGWYGCDYTQSSLQREVVLWSDDYGDKLVFLGKEGDVDDGEDDDDDDDEEALAKGTKRPLDTKGSSSKEKAATRGPPRKKVKQ